MKDSITYAIFYIAYVILWGENVEFSKVVKKVRTKLGMSQQQLADALNVSFATINRWENGHVVPSNLAQKSFFDFCENNFIDITSFEEKNNN